MGWEECDRASENARKLLALLRIHPFVLSEHVVCYCEPFVTIQISK